MASKTPAEAIEEALRRLPSVQLFTDEKQATAWASAMALGHLRTKLATMELSPDERDEHDPIEVVEMQAREIGTKPGKQRSGWIDALTDEVARATFCEVQPVSGTKSTRVIGRHSDRLMLKQVLGSLVPTAEKLAREAYYVEYTAHRAEGEVEKARGFVKAWQKRYIKHAADALKSARSAAIEERPEASNLLSAARNEVVAFMNENYLPTQGNKTARLRRR